MTRTTLATLLGTGLAAVVAWRLGGREGVGVLAGGVLAASVTTFGLARQRRELARDPKRVTHAMVSGMLLKLVALLVGALSLRFLEPLAARADWQSFVLAFVATSVVVLIPGAFDNARVLRESRAP